MESVIEKKRETAIAAKQPILAYYWTPNYFSTQVDLVHVPLPPYVPGCDADTAKITCTDYPPYALNKVVSKSFAESGSPAFTVVKNFTWTNADQDGVAYDIAVNKLSYDDAAKKWLDAHPDAWKAWFAGIAGF